MLVATVVMAEALGSLMDLYVNNVIGEKVTRNIIDSTVRPPFTSTSADKNSCCFC